MATWEDVYLYDVFVYSIDDPWLETYYYLHCMDHGVEGDDIEHGWYEKGKAPEGWRRICVDSWEVDVLVTWFHSERTTDFVEWLEKNHPESLVHYHLRFLSKYCSDYMCFEGVVPVNEDGEVYTRLHAVQSVLGEVDHKPIAKWLNFEDMDFCMTEPYAEEWAERTLTHGFMSP